MCNSRHDDKTRCMQKLSHCWHLPCQCTRFSKLLQRMHLRSTCLTCCRVALRIMEVPLAWFVSPVSLEDSPRPKVVQAALGRPLFISWSPDGSTIVHVSPNRRCKCCKAWFQRETQASVCRRIKGELVQSRLPARSQKHPSKCANARQYPTMCAGGRR